MVEVGLSKSSTSKLTLACNGGHVFNSFTALLHKWSKYASPEGTRVAVIMIRPDVQVKAMQGHCYRMQTGIAYVQLGRYEVILRTAIEWSVVDYIVTALINSLEILRLGAGP